MNTSKVVINSVCHGGVLEKEKNNYNCTNIFIQEKSILTGTKIFLLVHKNQMTLV